MLLHFQFDETSLTKEGYYRSIVQYLMKAFSVVKFSQRNNDEQGVLRGALVGKSRSESRKLNCQKKLE